MLMSVFDESGEHLPLEYGTEEVRYAIPDIIEDQSVPHISKPFKIHREDSSVEKQKRHLNEAASNRDNDLRNVYGLLCW